MEELSDLEMQNFEYDPAASIGQINLGLVKAVSYYIEANNGNSRQSIKEGLSWSKAYN